MGAGARERRVELRLVLLMKRVSIGAVFVHVGLRCFWRTSPAERVQERPDLREKFIAKLCEGGSARQTAAAGLRGGPSPGGVMG